MPLLMTPLMKVRLDTPFAASSGVLRFVPSAIACHLCLRTRIEIVNFYTEVTVECQTRNSARHIQPGSMILSASRGGRGTVRMTQNPKSCGWFDRAPDSLQLPRLGYSWPVPM